MEVIVFADIEQLLIDYLAEGLTGYGVTVSVSTRIPNPRPDACVVLMRTGGVGQTMVTDDALVTFDCRAPTEHEAASLAALVRGLVNAAEGTILDSVMIYRVREAAGPANNPDATTPDQARYSQLIQISYRGVVLEPISGGTNG